MKKRYGIWIDHEKAFLFRVNAEKIESMEALTSEVQPRHHSGVNDNEHSTLSNQSKHNERRNNQLDHFMKEILQKIHDADEILIFGPANVKNTLHNTIKETKSMSRVLVTVTVADKLTENQMRESVRDFFALPKGA